MLSVTYAGLLLSGFIGMLRYFSALKPSCPLLGSQIEPHIFSNSNSNTAGTAATVTKMARCCPGPEVLCGTLCWPNRVQRVALWQEQTQESLALKGTTPRTVALEDRNPGATPWEDKTRGLVVLEDKTLEVMDWESKIHVRVCTGGKTPRDLIFFEKTPVATICKGKSQGEGFLKREVKIVRFMAKEMRRWNTQQGRAGEVTSGTLYKW